MQQDRPTVTPTPAVAPKDDERPEGAPAAPPKPETRAERLQREDRTRREIARHRFPRAGKTEAERLCLVRRDWLPITNATRGRQGLEQARQRAARIAAESAYLAQESEYVA